MKATLDLSCSCGRDAHHDDDLTLSDAGFLRSWTMIHTAPGHTVTATIVAAHDEADEAPTPLLDASRYLTSLQALVTGLFRRR